MDEDEEYNKEYVEPELPIVKRELKTDGEDKDSETKGLRNETDGLVMDPRAPKSIILEICVEGTPARDGGTRLSITLVFVLYNF